ncbi:MAG: hypothetical protein HFI05_10865 [Lachnospiraceae bacterium]|nr:hypothetical protein [Lachnospiraceae bacterium]
MISYKIEVRRDIEGISGKVSISMVFGVSQLSIYFKIKKENKKWHKKH